MNSIQKESVYFGTVQTPKGKIKQTASNLVNKIHHVLESALLSINPTKDRLIQAENKLNFIKANLINERDDLIVKHSNYLEIKKEVAKLDNKISKINKELKALDKKMLKLGVVANKLHDLDEYCISIKQTFDKLQQNYKDEEDKFMNALQKGKVNLEATHPHREVWKEEITTLKHYVIQIKKELNLLNASFEKSSGKDETSQEKIEAMQRKFAAVDSLIRQGELQIQLDCLLHLKESANQLTKIQSQKDKDKGPESFSQKFLDKEINKVTQQINELSASIMENERAFTREDVIREAKDVIKARFNVDDSTAQDACSRLIASRHLSKVKGEEFATKMREAVNNIAAFGSCPQVYADEPQLKRGEDARNFAKFLFTDIGAGLAMASTKLARALLIKRDPELLKGVKAEFEYMGAKIVEEMNKKTSITPEEQMLTEMLVGNILAIYTFLDAKDGDKFKVPQFVDNQWQLATYDVTRIQMTPDELGEPMYAYGLSCFANRSAPPLLLFMGTPPPTVSGVKLAEWVDLAPGYSVGEIAYEYAKNQLVNWMDIANVLSNKKVECYGQSLGGSLSILCAGMHPDMIGKIYAYNPPSPTQEILDQCKENRSKFADIPEINVFMQKNDLVSYVGKGWDPEWNVYKVIPKNKHPSPYFAHIQGFSGQKNVLVHKVDVKADRVSKKRRLINQIADKVRVPLFRWKTASLKASMMIKGHTFASFLSKLYAKGLANFFKTIFSGPKEKYRHSKPFIQAMLADVAGWQP